MYKMYVMWFHSHLIYMYTHTHAHTHTHIYIYIIARSRLLNFEERTLTLKSSPEPMLLALPPLALWWPSHSPLVKCLLTNYIQPVHSEGDQPWDFFGRNDAKAETPVLWLPHAKSWLIGKDSDTRRDWGQEEKGTTEDETAGWHHWLDGHESQWTPGVGDGQGGLACCDLWGRKESDTIEQLIWSDLNIQVPLSKSGELGRIFIKSS